MPELSTSLHLDMLSQARSKNSLAKRLLRAFRWELAPPLYGLEWGDPDVVEPLKFIRDRYVLPYVDARHDAVEIGPGGGRWTRYLVGFKKLYAVDYHQELLDELKRNFRRRGNISFIRNNGTDFPGIASGSIDYLFSFGTFVHLEFHLIEAYLAAIRSIVRSKANIVIQYSDKTKVMAQLNKGFAENTPARMREAVQAAGFNILEEDTTSLWHSSVVRFTI
jgi:SAM-dependent methyltransferase